ncbi:DMT family transporter [Bacillus sp. T33-2]|uniref:DMT family transporter n=1 Tax=Bacillus sp. T33-2 TaxID=2054168 RepID=UPI000C79478A|nr:multidrug efflux SMR transporter [Bacillus sp. T33-2]PLR96789.1 QacE family quaternary ammonium compound efflux SMR transporter [Bacillus sp. T33-2]
MDRNWATIFIAGLFEIMWVIGLKHSHSFSQWIGTAVAILLSMYLLIAASRKLPVGTAYAVFTGIGTGGTVIMEMLLFGQPFSLAKVGLISILLLGVLGLKMVTENEQAHRGDS